MPKNEKPGEVADWRLATWDGFRREALRRWARLPLEQVIAALEEMQELSDMLAKAPADGEAASHPAAESAVHEQPGDYIAKAETSPRASRDAPPTGNRLPRKPNKKRRPRKIRRTQTNIAMAGNRPTPSRRRERRPIR